MNLLEEIETYIGKEYLKDFEKNPVDFSDKDLSFKETEQPHANKIVLIK